MSDVNKLTVNDLPPEMLSTILSHLTARELLVARDVSQTWRTIIDRVLNKKESWTMFCRKEFPYQYEKLKSRSLAQKTPRYLYRILAAWEHLDRSNLVSVDVPPVFQMDHGDALDMSIVNNVLSVYAKITLETYNPKNLGEIALTTYNSNHVFWKLKKYFNNEYYVIGLTSRDALVLFLNDNTTQQPNSIFRDISKFIANGTDLYLLDKNKQFFYCDTTKCWWPGLVQVVGCYIQGDILVLSICQGRLTFLTSVKKVYQLIDKKIVEIETVNRFTNIMQLLQRYNFLDGMDYSYYMSWMCQFGHLPPNAGYISFVYRWGDTYFVAYEGDNEKLMIFYKPYINGEIDLFRSIPSKTLDFKRLQYHTVGKVSKMEVIETVHGHKLFVAFSNVIIVIKLLYVFVEEDPFNIKPVCACSSYEMHLCIEIDDYNSD